jgi:hypothetical protein
MVYYSDLIGRPWKLHGKDEAGIDCAGVCELILVRLGQNPPRIVDLREGDAFRRIVDYFDKFSEHFSLLGRNHTSAVQEGDLIVSDPDGQGVSAHISVLVDLSTKRCVTSTFEHGVLAVPARAIKNVIGVYRLKEDSE